MRASIKTRLETEQSFSSRAGPPAAMLVSQTIDLAGLATTAAARTRTHLLPLDKTVGGQKMFGGLSLSLSLPHMSLSHPSVTPSVCVVCQEGQWRRPLSSLSFLSEEAGKPKGCIGVKHFLWYMMCCCCPCPLCSLSAGRTQHKREVPFAQLSPFICKLVSGRLPSSPKWTSRSHSRPRSSVSRYTPR